LKRLAAAIEAADCRKGVDEAGLEEQLAAVRALFPVERYPEVDLPHASKFDWDFLSFCFALATGVGKTRLMGAIIAYLYRVKGFRNFVVIAPGKTVYEKLISDFTEGSPKYVFRGLSCFATKKPVVVTGDTYQSGAGLLDERDLLGHSIAINIFNIQKLNERGDTHDDAQKEVAKIRRLNERIGQSYFDYLKSRDDLVVLMDEAHHYRASAAAETIAALQPVLGIEMTATPRVGNRPFRNVLCEYGLAKAMADGFVKEPAVVRRQNFRKDDYTNRADDLDRQKLTDAMVVHGATMSALAEYAFKNGMTKVKRCVRVVAPDT
jgi:type III restriction enzyme